MITIPDTNTIAQAGQAAQQIKETMSPWVPSIVVAGAWIGRELGNFTNWANIESEKIIAHGGIVKMIGKLIWNSNGG